MTCAIADRRSRKLSQMSGWSDATNSIQSIDWTAAFRSGGDEVKSLLVRCVGQNCRTPTLYVQSEEGFHFPSAGFLDPKGCYIGIGTLCAKCERAEVHPRADQSLELLRIECRLMGIELMEDIILHEESRLNVLEGIYGLFSCHDVMFGQLRYQTEATWNAILPFPSGPVGGRS